MNERMVEHILRLSGEIDELGRHQFVDDRLNTQHRQ